MTGKTIHLRGHHLCCLLTYVGEGPCGAFVRHLDHIASQFNGSTQIQIVRGVDDICASGGVSQCPLFPRCKENPSMERRDTLMLSALSLLPNGGVWDVGIRRTVNEGMIWHFRQAARHGAFLEVCEGCAYEDLCRCVAARGFEGARLFPPRAAAPLRPEGVATCAM